MIFDKQTRKLLPRGGKTSFGFSLILCFRSPNAVFCARISEYRAGFLAQLRTDTVAPKRKSNPTRHTRLCVARIRLSGQDNFQGVVRHGVLILVAGAHRNDGKRFVVRADEILPAFWNFERPSAPRRIGLTSRHDFSKTQRC
jgi:hypothetical protein